MDILAFALQGAGYGLAAASQPGPFQAYLISQALQHGWRRTAPAALAPLISDGPVVALVLLALTRVPEGFQVALRLAGGIFSFYLAWVTWRAWRRFDPAAAALPGARSGGVLRAAAMNILGPGPWVFWSLVAGPIFLHGWQRGPAVGIGFLVGFYAAMLGVLAALILAFGAARRLGPSLNRALLGISAVALAAFGAYQLWLGLSSIWQRLA